MFGIALIYDVGNLQCSPVVKEPGEAADAETMADTAPDPYKLWCGRSLRQAAEECRRRCPSGNDDECGTDAAGRALRCFDMRHEEAQCMEEGVGVREPADPANLWCGSSYLQLAENCQKACPDGDDASCGSDIFARPMVR